MKNALIFFYNLYLDEIKKINNNHYFSYQNNDYVISLYNRDISEITDLYQLNVEMLQNGVNMYQIIPTKENSLLFYYENNYYVLMRIPMIKNKVITFDDILSFNYLTQNNKFNKLDKSNWPIFWEQKIDYVEYQFSQTFKKYKNLNDTIYYYIGVWENGISYYNDNVNNSILNKYVCHKRIGVETDLLEFLNPLNFVIDYKERDLGEYLKSYICGKKYTYDNLSLMLDKLSKDRNDTMRLISRLLFPSFYFDIYESIIFDKEHDDKILDIDKQYKNYEEFLKFIFKYYQTLNIPSIDWIIK